MQEYSLYVKNIHANGVRRNGVGLQGRPKLYTINFTPTKDPQCWPFWKQPANRLQSHLKQLWGAAESGFLQAEEGYYCTFSLNNKYLYQIELRYSLNQLRSQIKYVSCLTLNWEFTTKLLFNSYLTLSIIYLSMHKIKP